MSWHCLPRHHIGRCRPSSSFRAKKTGHPAPGTTCRHGVGSKGVPEPQVDFITVSTRATHHRGHQVRGWVDVEPLQTNGPGVDDLDTAGMPVFVITAAVKVAGRQPNANAVYVGHARHQSPHEFMPVLARCLPFLPLEPRVQQATAPVRINTPELL